MKAFYNYVTEQLSSLGFPVYQDFAPPRTVPSFIVYDFTINMHSKMFTGDELIIGDLNVTLWMESERIDLLQDNLRLIGNLLDKKRFTLIDYNKKVSGSILLVKGPTIRKVVGGYLNGTLTFSTHLSM